MWQLRHALPRQRLDAETGEGVRLLAALFLIAVAAVAVAKVAIDHGAAGVENGVVWLIGLVAFLVMVACVEARLERRR